MFRSKTQFFIVALLLALVLTLGVSQSQACWRCGGWGWGGYYGGWYSPWTTWYAGYGYNYGYGWGGWRHGCWGCASPCWGCCDPCGCGAVVSDCGCGGVVADCGCGGAVTNPAPAPAQPTPAQPAPTPAQPAPALPPQPPAPGASTDYFPAPETSGLLTVSVPADAKVLVNGRPTQSTGSTREFVAHNLVPGLTYKFIVVAQIVRDGKVVEDTQVVTLTAGAQEGLAFGFNPKAADQVASN